MQGIPKAHVRALFTALELGGPIETVGQRDTRVTAVIDAARGGSYAAIESMGLSLVNALGQEFISTSDLRAVLGPVVNALVRGQLNGEESKALLLGVVRGIGGPTASRESIATYLDALADGRSTDDLSVLSVGLYAMGQALGPQALGSGRYQQAVDAIHTSLASFPRQIRLDLAQAFLDSLSAPVAGIYREAHPGAKSGGDSKGVLERVTQALVANPHWRELETLLGQAATDPGKLKAGCHRLVKALGAGPTPAGMFQAILNLVADGACRHTPQALGGAVQGLCEALGAPALDEASLGALAALAMTDPRCGPVQAGAMAEGIARALGGEKASPAQRESLFSLVLGTQGAEPKKVQAAFVALVGAFGVEQLAGDELQVIAVCIKTSALPDSQKAAMTARLPAG